MLIDHAPSVRDLNGNKRSKRRRILFLLLLFILALALFSFSCFNLHPFDDNKPTLEIQKTVLMEADANDKKHMPLLPKIVKKNITVSPGDTLMELFVREGIERTDAYSIISSLSDLFNPRQLRQGQEIILNFETPPPSGTLFFHSLTLALILTRRTGNPSSEGTLFTKEVYMSLRKRESRQ
jgi:hypothetical protein